MSIIYLVLSLRLLRNENSRLVPSFWISESTRCALRRYWCLVCRRVTQSQNRFFAVALNRAYIIRRASITYYLEYTRKNRESSRIVKKLFPSRISSAKTPMVEKNFGVNFDPKSLIFKYWIFFSVFYFSSLRENLHILELEKSFFKGNKKHFLLMILPISNIKKKRW